MEFYEKGKKMDKRSFIEQLRRSLSSIEDDVFLNDTISYYENYINCEIRKAKSEEQVMQELGDPRLIAKSIIASYNSESEDSSEYSQFFGENTSSKKKSDLGERVVFQFNRKKFQLPLWLVKILKWVIPIMVFVLLVFILGFILPLLFKILLPAALAYIVYRAIVKRM